MKLSKDITVTICVEANEIEQEDLDQIAKNAMDKCIKEIDTQVIAQLIRSGIASGLINWDVTFKEEK